MPTARFLPAEAIELNVCRADVSRQAESLVARKLRCAREERRTGRSMTLSSSVSMKSYFHGVRGAREHTLAKIVQHMHNMCMYMSRGNGQGKSPPSLYGTSAEALAAAAAEGLELEAASSKSGYKWVALDDRFRAGGNEKSKKDGKDHTGHKPYSVRIHQNFLGSFVTAEEAAMHAARCISTHGEAAFKKRGRKRSISSAVSGNDIEGEHLDLGKDIADALYSVADDDKGDPQAAPMSDAMSPSSHECGHVLGPSTSSTLVVSSPDPPQGSHLSDSTSSLPEHVHAVEVSCVAVTSASDAEGEAPELNGWTLQQYQMRIVVLEMKIAAAKRLGNTALVARLEQELIDM